MWFSPAYFCPLPFAFGSVQPETYKIEWIRESFSPDEWD
jgi:hypothetical protein